MFKAVTFKKTGKEYFTRLARSLEARPPSLGATER